MHTPVLNNVRRQRVPEEVMEVVLEEVGQEVNGIEGKTIVL